MSLQSEVRAALADIETTMTNAVVTVVSGDESCSGLRGTAYDATSPDPFGEQGIDSATVRVDASELTAPDKGATITVDGDEVLVTNIQSDPVNGLMVISYDLTRPVEGV